MDTLNKQDIIDTTTLTFTIFHTLDNIINCKHQEIEEITRFKHELSYMLMEKDISVTIEQYMYFMDCFSKYKLYPLAAYEKLHLNEAL